ncbi:hypothetical protein M2277_002998 [Paenibacillus sp. LBL]|uniref:hypothetical protein n=1 Tax=Paenibacillus sp. LBL TaxID=2940563 RepID=UPI002476C618|nr:hypothetical protein [Paenibacillus sp. LBL]MDH6672336.1 hypothetical protein [Paenibacillus sp. LBL]
MSLLLFICRKVSKIISNREELDTFVLTSRVKIWMFLINRKKGDVMSKVRSSKRMASTLAVSVLLSLSLAGGAYADSATDIAPGALTTPPPVEMNLNSSFNLLANKYLINYYSTISKVNSTQVSLNGFTGAGQAVDTIGINFVLQRWTGSAWIDTGSAYENGSNKTSLSGIKNFSVQTGYYYRGKTIHWINENGTYEEATYYTNSILAEQ